MKKPIATLAVTTIITDRRLWLLLSPTLPVGGYSFSHGLESAVAEGLVSNNKQAHAWIQDIGMRMLLQLDLPILLRMLSAVQQGAHEQLCEWNEYLLASRESAELLAEDQHMGAALNRLRPAWQLPEPGMALPGPASFAASFAQLCTDWNIDDHEAANAYAWIWFENQVAAAVKLVPLGQSDGQALLLALSEQLETLVGQAKTINDTELGAGTPGLAILSSHHEALHGRIFQS